MDNELHLNSMSSTYSPHEEFPAAQILDCSYPDCGFKSIWKEAMDCHDKGHDSTSPTTRGIACQICPQIFRTLASFFYHMSSQHSNKLFCPWCLFHGEDLTEFKAHVFAHSEIQPVSTGPSNRTSINSLKAQTPKSSKFHCDTCFKSFKHRYSLQRHKKMNHFNANSFTNSIRKQAEICNESQELFEGPELANPTAADETLIIPSDETQSEGTAGFLIKKVNIEGETFYSCTICSHKTKRKDNLRTHLLVHTNQRPFGCPVGDCDYRGKSFQHLKKHCHVHHNINLPAQTNAPTWNTNLGLGLDCNNQTEVNVNNSTDFSMAFACTLCEFVGDSELAALEHAQQHNPSYF